MKYAETHPLVRQCALMHVLTQRDEPITLGELSDRVDALSDDEVTCAVERFAAHVAGHVTEWQQQ